MPLSRYQVLLADEPASLTEHFRLRYRVYCLDKGYEDPARFPDGLERDADDDHAVHLLARERAGGGAVAALRLVLPSATRFPCERIGGFDAEAVTGLPRRQLVELSRLSLPKPGPRLVGAARDAGGMLHSSAIALALYQAAYAYSREQGYSHWLGFTSPAMRRLLSSQHVRLEALGAPQQHRGERQLHLIPCRFLAAQLARPGRPAYASARQLLLGAASVA